MLMNVCILLCWLVTQSSSCWIYFSFLSVLSIIHIVNFLFFHALNISNWSNHLSPPHIFLTLSLVHWWDFLLRSTNHISGKKYSLWVLIFTFLVSLVKNWIVTACMLFGWNCRFLCRIIVLYYFSHWQPWDNGPFLRDHHLTLFRLGGGGYQPYP